MFEVQVRYPSVVVSGFVLFISLFLLPFSGLCLLRMLFRRIDPSYLVCAKCSFLPFYLRSYATYLLYWQPIRLGDFFGRPSFSTQTLDCHLGRVQKLRKYASTPHDNRRFQWLPPTKHVLPDSLFLNRFSFLVRNLKRSSPLIRFFVCGNCDEAPSLPI